MASPGSSPAKQKDEEEQKVASEEGSGSSPPTLTPPHLSESRSQQVEEGQQQTGERQDEPGASSPPPGKTRRKSMSPPPSMAGSSSQDEEQPGPSTDPGKRKRDSSPPPPGQSEETRNREDFLKYFCELTLDPDTAHRNLRLSADGRSVSWGRQPQPHLDPELPQRFHTVPQVLCREGLSGERCYWEVEWTGDWALIGVAYSGIGRKGWAGGCVIGGSDRSWSLDWDGTAYTAWHRNQETEIAAPYSPRIGVELDPAAGTLSFYSVSPERSTLSLLHIFRASFTEPLYPGFKLCHDSTITLCQLGPAS